eukprot:g484.t1
MLIPALVLIRFYDFSMRLRGMKRDADIKQSYARRHEIERELRMKEFDAGKIAAAIDKHENFDRPQSLRVTAGVLDTKLTLHTLQQGGTKKVLEVLSATLSWSRKPHQQQYLRKRKRDVQQVLKKEWMPLELRRAFVAFDMLCMKSEWFTPFYRLAGSHDGRMRAGAWLRRDPELRSPAVHIAEEVDLQFMLRVQRALPWQLRKLLPQTSEASET